MRTIGTIRPAAAGLTALILLAIAGCGGSAGGTGVNKAGGTVDTAPTVLALANNNHGVPPQLGEFADEVARLSDGTIRIEVNEGWRDGEREQESDTIEDVRAGAVDMAWVGARAFDTVGVTSFRALLAPLLVDSYDLQGAVFDSGIAARMLADVDAAGLAGVAILPGPMRKMMGISHPFLAPADFSGQVVGHSGGALAETALTALGATPQLVPAQTSLDGLDALDYQLQAIHGNSYEKEASHVTANLNLWPRPLVIVMNADAFDALTAEQQDALRTAGANAASPALDASRAEDAEAGPNLCRAGMAVVEAGYDDLAAIRTVLEPVYAELEEDPQTKTYLDEIRSLKATVGAPAESLTCAEETDSGTTDALSGTWTASGVTCAQQEAAMERAGFTSEDLDEAWGTDRCAYSEFVLEFEAGTLEVLLDGEVGWSGRYRIEDDTTFVAGDQGDFYITYKYAIDGDQLTVDMVENNYPAADELLGENIAQTMIYESAPFVSTESTSAAASSTPIDGVWATTFTYDELAESPELMDAGELNDENWGDLTLRFDRHIFTGTQSNDVSSPRPESEPGSFKLDEDTITLDLPNGERFVCRWSLYRDSLTFERDDALGICPTPFLVKPWTRQP